MASSGSLTNLTLKPFTFQTRTILMMMNCFCGMVDQRKAFSLISSWDHCQRFLTLRISDMPQAGFEPAQNLSSGFVEWSCAVVVTTTPRLHLTYWHWFFVHLKLLTASGIDIFSLSACCHMSHRNWSVFIFSLIFMPGINSFIATLSSITTNKDMKPIQKQSYKTQSGAKKQRGVEAGGY